MRTRPGVALTVLLGGFGIVATTSFTKANTGPVHVDDVFQLLWVLALVAVGAVTVWQRSDNRISWLFVWLGIALGLSLLADELSTLRYAGEQPALVMWASWFSNWFWVPAFGPLFTLLFLWFPTGRLPSPRWKPVERFAVVLILALSLLLAFSQDPESNAANPLALPWVTAIMTNAFTVIGPTFPILVAVCAASLIVRFRSARGDQRQQLKWFVFAAVLLPIYMILDTAWGISGVAGPDPVWMPVVEITAFLSLPIATAIAILKYRLYDIDVVINRALVYGLLSAILGAMYVGLVFALQAALSPITAESDLAIAGSTLAVAALFRPVRGRVQGFIDHRFYRRKFDAQRTLEEFNAHLRDEVDLQALSTRLEVVVQETMQPAHVSLWLRGNA